MSAAQACIMQYSAEFGMHRRTVRGTPAAVRVGGRVGVLGEGPVALFAVEEGTLRARRVGLHRAAEFCETKVGQLAVAEPAGERRRRVAHLVARCEAAQVEDRAFPTAAAARRRRHQVLSGLRS